MNGKDDCGAEHGMLTNTVYYSRLSAASCSKVRGLSEDILHGTAL